MLNALAPTQAIDSGTPPSENSQLEPRQVQQQQARELANKTSKRKSR
jgi:hypothetical protein